MPTTPNMNLVTPTEDSVAEAGTWDTILNALFDRIDIHDHTTGLGLPIPGAALKINADVAWSFGGTNYAVTSLRAVDFAPSTAASVAGYAAALFVNSDDANNLYFRTQAGTNVKIVDGTTLNIAIAGAIGGDYASIGALLDYDDPTDTYRFRQQSAASVRQYAKLASGDIKLIEYLAAGATPVPSFGVTLKSPAALAANYSITMPAAVPASTRSLWMTTAGLLEAGRSTTLARRFPPSVCIPKTGTPTRANNGAITLGAGPPSHYYPIPLNVGDTITAWTLYINKASAVGTSIIGRLWKEDSTGALTAIDVATSAPGGALGNPGNTTITQTLAAAETVGGTGVSYWLEVTVTGGGSGDFLNTLEVLIRPV